MPLFNLQKLLLIAYSLALIILLVTQFSWPPSPLALFLLVQLMILFLLFSGGFFKNCDEAENAIVPAMKQVQVEEIPHYNHVPVDAVVLSIQEDNRGALVLHDLPYVKSQDHNSLELAIVDLEVKDSCKQLVLSSTSSGNGGGIDNNDEKSIIPVASPRRRKKKKSLGNSKSKRSNVDINSDELLVRSVPPLALTLQMDDLTMDDFNRSCASFIQVKKCEMQQESKQEWRLALTH